MIDTQSSLMYLRDRMRAKRAWGEAVKIADPAAIIAAAKRYAIECEGRPAWSILPADVWLRERRWLDYPAERKVDLGSAP